MNPDTRALSALLTPVIADARRLVAALEAIPPGSNMPLLLTRSFWPLHQHAAKMQALADLAHLVVSCSPPDDPPVVPSPSSN